jgi:FkbM family methyltransferase
MLKKLARTAQNYLPGLAEVKNEAYHWARATFRLAHDSAFAALVDLPRRENELFIDVGANRGQSILSMRRYRPDAPIVCFEPNPRMMLWLKAHFAAEPMLTLIEAGLGPRVQRRTLYTPHYRGFPYDGLATFCETTARRYLSPETVFGFDPAALTLRPQVCAMLPLDAFALEPTFIKIDVEGGEFGVLQGAARTLERCRPVLMIERFYGDDRVDELLQRSGYREMVHGYGGFRAGRGTGENAFWAPAEDQAFAFNIGDVPCLPASLS